MFFYFSFHFMYIFTLIKVKCYVYIFNGKQANLLFYSGKCTRLTLREKSEVGNPILVLKSLRVNEIRYK